MNQYEQQQLEYFSQRLKKYGFSHRTLSWESPFTQNCRFVELLKICTMGQKYNDFSLLDFGCGLGHLYKFIKDEGFLSSWQVNYIGTDINKELLNEARKNFPNANFVLKEENIFQNRYDYIVCSGLYNLKFSEDFDISKHYTSELKDLFACANEGLSVNFQTEKALLLIPKWHQKTELKRFYFHDPQKIFDDLKTITSNISISTNYLPGDYDITFYLLK